MGKLSEPDSFRLGLPRTELASGRPRSFAPRAGGLAVEGTILLLLPREAQLFGSCSQYTQICLKSVLLLSSALLAAASWGSLSRP